MSDSLGDVVTGSCMLPDMGLGPQEEQYVLLTTKPSLQSQGFLFFSFLFFFFDTGSHYVALAGLELAWLRTHAVLSASF